MTRTFLTASITTFITGSTSFLSFAGLVLFLADSGTPDELPAGWMSVLCLLLGLCVLSSGVLSVSTGRFVAELIGDGREGGRVGGGGGGGGGSEDEDEDDNDNDNEDGDGGSAGALEEKEEEKNEERNEVGNKEQQTEVSARGQKVDYYQQLAEGFDRMSQW